MAVFAVAGLGLGLGYTFVNVATQGLVPLERTGEASGVVLTVVVTMGGIGVALASSMILGFEDRRSGLTEAYSTTLRIFAVLCCGWAILVSGARAVLVRRGAMAPAPDEEQCGSGEVRGRQTRPWPHSRNCGPPNGVNRTTMPGDATADGR